MHAQQAWIKLVEKNDARGGKEERMEEQDAEVTLS